MYTLFEQLIIQIFFNWNKSFFNNQTILVSLKYKKPFSYIRVIPQGTVDNNLGPDRLADPKALDPNYYRQHSLIARPLSGSPNCAWY